MSVCLLSSFVLCMFIRMLSVNVMFILILCGWWMF